jgi:hypothetical protein
MWGHPQDGPRETLTDPCPGPDRGPMEPNGVAREFWSEVFDLRLTADDVREKRPTKVRQKRVRRTSAPRPQARAS